MGGGTWTVQSYDRVTKGKIDTGTTFAYTSYAKTHGVREAHEDLRIIKDGKILTRESRDSDEHPESTPIVIGFDVTGSMGENPAILQKALKGLFGMLVRKGVVSDPQVAIGAYGDTVYDNVPVQFSQFESDNRIDDNLDNVYVERGGGGNSGEMSTALVWYVAHHVATDAWEKRGKKGYLFLVGDESALPVSADAASRFLMAQGEITPEDAFNDAMEKWEVYFLLVDNWAARDQHSEHKYKQLIGDDRVIVLQSTESAPAVVAAVIGLAEDTVDADSLTTELAESGFSAEVAMEAAKATASGTVSKVVEYPDLSL